MYLNNIVGIKRRWIYSGHLDVFIEEYKKDFGSMAS